MFDLVELSTGNLLGSYERAEDAYRDVRETAKAYGPDAVATLGLAEVSYNTQTLIADGDELLARANAEGAPAPA